MFTIGGKIKVFLNKCLTMCHSGQHYQKSCLGLSSKSTRLCLQLHKEAAESFPYSNLFSTQTYKVYKLGNKWAKEQKVKQTFECWGRCQLKKKYLQAAHLLGGSRVFFNLYVNRWLMSQICLPMEMAVRMAFSPLAFAKEW